MTDLKARRYLEPFIGKERCVSDAARELDVAMSSVLYRVRRFLDLGLLTMTRQQSRAGRAIRFYRAIADGFFIPYHLTDMANIGDMSPQISEATLEVFNKNLSRTWQAASGAQSTWGITVFRNREGFVESDVVPESSAEDPSTFFRGLLEPNAPAVWDSWSIMHLKFDSAKALQHELRNILEQFQEQAVEPDGKTYIVRLAMTPIEET
jgi:hypothetical protein